MKDEDRDEFVEWSKCVWRYNLPLIENYKPLLVHRDNAILLDLSLKIQAYDFGIRMQARTDFRNDWFSYHTEEGYIERSDEREVETKVNNSFQSSFENIRSKKIKSLVLEAELMHTPSKVEPLEPERSEKPPLRKEITLNDDLEQVYHPNRFGSNRQDIAKNLKEEFLLSNDVISRIQYLAFDEVVSLVNRKYNSDFLSKNITSLIQFLERSIEIYFPLFLKDLKWNGKVLLLSEFRKSSRQHFNTACHRCGKRLFKKNNKQCCTRSENRSCYETRFKENRDSGFPMTILRTRNKCDNCGIYSSLNNIHKYEGIQRQFCSSKCWETFRKREYRKKKKNIN